MQQMQAVAVAATATSTETSAAKSRCGSRQQVNRQRAICATNLLQDNQQAPLGPPPS